MSRAASAAPTAWISVATNLLNSPVYYLQQNDVIYVEPDKALARQAADNPNNLKSISLWTGMATFLMSIAVLIAK